MFLLGLLIYQRSNHRVSISPACASPPHGAPSTILSDVEWFGINDFGNLNRERSCANFRRTVLTG